MPGGAGRLVVLDRSGRAGRQFQLTEGAATIGKASGCDVRVLQPSVAPHHATVVVHSNQTIIRNVGEGETLVNGKAVSVAALRHDDVITVGERSLRWQYMAPPRAEPAHLPEVPHRAGRGAGGGGGGGGRAARRVTAAAPADAQPRIHKILEMQHRASMPASVGSKQVAVVQPQRRDTSQHTVASPHRSAPASPRSANRARASTARSDPAPAPAPALEMASPAAGVSDTTTPRSPRQTPKYAHNATPNTSLNTSKTKLSTPIASPSILQDTTKATLWIESRKASPRKSAPSAAGTSPRSVPRRAASAKKSTPLRLAVLRRAGGAGGRGANVTKIEGPLKIDAMKQAALMLMAGHSRRLSSPKQSPAAPSLPVGRRSLGRRSQGSTKRKSTRGSKGKSVSVLEITDTDTTLYSSVASDSDFSTRSRSCPLGSPLPQSPKKSALKDPTAKNRSRKNESIKFDLSNLENYSQEDDVLMVTASSRSRKNITSHSNFSEEDVTLQYEDSSTFQSPSPRRSIHSRASKMLEQVGSPLKDSRVSQYKDATLTPESPRSRKSLRGSIILQKALDTTENNATTHSRRTTKTLTDHSFDRTAESAFRTRTLSPRSARNMESYSIVDLVSIDSNESGRSASMYDSVGSTRSSSIVFGTPQGSTRKTGSTIDLNLLTSSTPYVGKTRASIRSNSNPSIRRGSSSTAARSSASTRRSKSLTTPENSEETQKHISINSTRISRASRSRSRINDSDLQLLNSSIGDSESPKTSRRSTASGKPGSKSSSPKSNSRISSSSVGENSLRTSQASSRKSILHTSLSDSVSQLSPRRSTSQSSPKNNESKISSRRSQSQVSPQSNAQTSPRRTSQVSLRRSTSSKSPSESASLKNASPQKSPGSHSSKRSSRSNLTLDINQSTENGTITPENRNSPPEAGTPVLSIQSLLDSSQSSFSSQRSPKNTRGSINIKRKTIGVLRSGKKARTSPKSKSFTISTRKSLRTVGEQSEFNESIEENVTPKSAVKLVQEAVKNKHSTAKKPQSKRSIIDNLNESDIVKHLFNSPVKRKLSQSMTEFSRKKLFDDDDVPRRPTRNTIALNGRTPDNSLLDNTDRYTPEQFVSPLSTPGNSPNITGVKRLYGKNTTPNNLTNVKRVTNVLCSPRTRKSVKNDLTNVSGVKTVFAKSPRNRLSDVRVKEIFKASPKNDLRRVTGVKNLFQSEKKRKSPRNDLSDVRGVKKLFNRKSATNDLRNVSGVKKTLRNRSPRNDLRDVRGVKRMFHEPRSDDSAELSGVEELFNTSTVSNISTRDPEALFDQLIGKPPIKAVYSKSFTSNRSQKKKFRRNSLRKSIELITNNVDQWIEQELQKCLHKDKANQSRKSYVSRELQKLATDTVTGNEIRSSRIRNSTLTKSTDEGKKRTASEVYSAHTLPIKKRSFVEASLEKTANELKANRSSRLPIKKRAVVHSTPVKGRYDPAMDASDLGRVSPIAALDATRAHHHTGTGHINRSKLPISPKRASRSNFIEESEMVVVEEPPKSRKQTRKSIITKNDKTQSSITPVKSPRGKNVSKSPQLARANRSEIEKSLILSPKGRKTKASILNASNRKVASLKGLPTKGSPKVVITRMARVISSKASPKVVSPKAKGRRTKASVSEMTTESSPKPKRGRRKASATTIAVDQPRSRRTRNNTDTEKLDRRESPKKGRGKKTIVEKEVSVQSRKTVQKAAVKEKSPQKSKEKTEPSPKKTRGSRTKASPVKVQKNTRNKTDVIKVTKTQKNRKSLVITKKAPVMSPQPAAKQADENVAGSRRAPRRKVGVEKPKSPVKTPKAKTPKAKTPKAKTPKAKTPKAKTPKAKTRKAKTPKGKTPKATRARLVVAKPSPKLNPRRAKVTQNATDSSKKESLMKLGSPKRTRRNAPAASPKKTRKAEPKTSVAKKPVENTEPSPPAKRGRSQRVEDSEPVAKRGRPRQKSPVKPKSPKRQTEKHLTQLPPITSKNTRGKNVSQESSQASKTNRRTNTKVEPTEEPQRRRKRKSADDVSATSAKIAKSEAKSTRGRKPVAVVKNTSPVKKASPVQGKAKIISPLKRITKAASPVKGKAKPVSPVKGKPKAASPVKGKTKATSPVKGKAKAVSPVKGKAKAVSPVKGKTASPMKERATRNKMEHSAKAKREESIIRSTRGKRQTVNESKTAGKIQAAKETATKTQRGQAGKAAEKKTQGKKVSAASATATSSRSKKGPASPAKVVITTRSRRR